MRYNKGEMNTDGPPSSIDAANNSLKRRANRRGSKKASLLELELVQLLLAIHFDDERDDKDEESGAGDPGSFSSASEELLGDEDGVRSSLSSSRHR